MSVIVRTTTRLVVPLIVLLSLALFVQGHNDPGGGFIAGVLTTTAFALIYIAFGLDFLERDVLGRDVEPGTSPFEERIVYAYRRLFAAGLTIAVGSGIAAVALGYPFLTQDYEIIEGIPIYHEIEIASALVFDVGVYCVVVGGLLTILSVVGAE